MFDFDSETVDGLFRPVIELINELEKNAKLNIAPAK